METKIKRAYTRDELEAQNEGPDGFVDLTCVLCGGTGFINEKEIKHEENCPMACLEVLGIMVTTLSRPREDICGWCPADESNCPAGDWTEGTHESLMVQCGKYAVDDKRIERS